MINGTGKLKASSKEGRKRFSVWMRHAKTRIQEQCFNIIAWYVFSQDDSWPEIPNQRITLKTFIIYIQGKDILLIATIFQSQTVLSFISYVKLSAFGCITHCFQRFPFLDRNHDCCDNTVIMHMPCRAFWSLGNEGLQDVHQVLVLNIH